MNLPLHIVLPRLVEVDRLAVAIGDENSPAWREREPTEQRLRDAILYALSHAQPPDVAQVLRAALEGRT